MTTNGRVALWAEAYGRSAGPGVRRSGRGHLPFRALTRPAGGIRPEHAPPMVRRLSRLGVVSSSSFLAVAIVLFHRSSSRRIPRRAAGPLPCTARRWLSSGVDRLHRPHVLGLGLGHSRCGRDTRVRLRAGLRLVQQRRPDSGDGRRLARDRPRTADRRRLRQINPCRRKSSGACAACRAAGRRTASASIAVAPAPPPTQRLRLHSVSTPIVPPRRTDLLTTHVTSRRRKKPKSSSLAAPSSHRSARRSGSWPAPALILLTKWLVPAYLRPARQEHSAGSIVRRRRAHRSRPRAVAGAARSARGSARC